MTERRRRLLMLLWSLDDLLPGPKGARFGHGLAPAAKASCPACGHGEAPGWLVDRFGRRSACQACGGVEGKAGRGWVRVDPMDATQQPLRTEASEPATRAPGTVSCDGCGGSGVGGAHLRDTADPESEYRDPCARCGGSGRRVVAAPFSLEVEASAEGAQLEAQLDRRREQGSYHELEEALAGLPGRWRRLVRAVHVRQTRTVEELDPVEWAILEASLVALEFLLPDVLRVPGGVRAAWRRGEVEGRTLAVGRGVGQAQREKRDKEIRKAVREGKPTQWVARQYGLSVSAVNRVVAGQAEDVA